MAINLPKIVFFLLSLPRYAKVIVAVLVDLSFCVLSIWLALYFRLGEFVILSNGDFVAAILVIIALTTFFIFGLYKEIFRFSGFKALFIVFRAICIYGIIFASIVTVITIENVAHYWDYTASSVAIIRRAFKSFS